MKDGSETGTKNYVSHYSPSTVKAYLRPMDQLLQQIGEYKKEVSAFAAKNADEAEQFRIKFLGTKGIVKAVMGEMKNVPNEKKKEFGQVLNEFKQFVESRYEELKASGEGSEEVS